MEPESCIMEKECSFGEARELQVGMTSANEHTAGSVLWHKRCWERAEISLLEGTPGAPDLKVIEFDSYIQSIDCIDPTDSATQLRAVKLTVVCSG